MPGPTIHEAHGAIMIQTGSYASSYAVDTVELATPRISEAFPDYIYFRPA